MIITSIVKPNILLVKFLKLVKHKFTGIIRLILCKPHHGDNCRETFRYFTDTVLHCISHR